MQITSTPHTSFSISSVSAVPKTQPVQYQQSSDAKIHEVKGRYDMTNISPREVDQAAQELVDAGAKDVVKIGALLLKGENWHAHTELMLADVKRETGIEIELPSFAPNQKRNLVAETQENIEYLKGIGKDTTHAEEFLAFLKSFHGESGSIHSASAGVAAASEAALARQYTALN